MKEVIRKIARVFLGGLLAGAPVQSQGEGVDLKNGYAAESYVTLGKLDLATAAVIGEVSPRKTTGGYELVPNERYNRAKPAEWDFWYAMVCKAADNKDEDKFITNGEAQAYLDDITKYLCNEPPPTEYFGH